MNNRELKIKKLVVYLHLEIRTVRQGVFLCLNLWKLVSRNVTIDFNYSRSTFALFSSLIIWSVLGNIFMFASNLFA